MLIDGVFHLGLSHVTAPLELREMLACTAPSMCDADAFRRLGISELLILSTCNRFELYAHLDQEVGDAERRLRTFLLQESGLAPAPLAERLTFRAGEAAVTHLLRVSAGLHSMVLGESQVLGQVTDAYLNALEKRTIGSRLSCVFRAAIRTGKRVRSETAIGRNPASISSIAINQAEQISGDLHSRRLLIVGAGAMGQLALKSIQARGLRQVTVLNRTPARAEAAAKELGWQAGGLAELPQALARADVVISATTAMQPLITAGMVEAALGSRSASAPLVLIDLAVPRDIDPRVATLAGVHVVDIDDLRGELDQALAARRLEIPKVERIIGDELAELQHEMQALTVRPTLVDLRLRAEEIRRGEVERMLNYLHDVDPETLEHIQHMSHALVNKLLHEPTVRLKELAGSGQSEPYVSAVRTLFDLHTNGEDAQS